MTMITPSYLGETIEYSSLHACRSTLEDPTSRSGSALRNRSEVARFEPAHATSCKLATSPPYHEGILRWASISPSQSGTTVEDEKPIEFAMANRTISARDGEGIG